MLNETGFKGESSNDKATDLGRRSAERMEQVLTQKEAV
jgi:hypothetical protein